MGSPRKYTKCNFCGSNDARFLYRVKEFIFRKEKFNIIQCNECDLVYTNPQPRADIIAKYYPTEYYSPFQFVYPDLLFPEEITRLRKFKNWWKRVILKLHYGYFGKRNLKKENFIKRILKFLTLPLKYHIGWIFPP